MKRSINVVVAVTIALLALFALIPAHSTRSYSVTVFTDKAEYAIGDLIRIFGNVTDEAGNAVEGVDVGIEVDKPDGTPIFVDQQTTNASGMFETSFRLPLDAPEGTYNVTATYGGAQGLTRFNVTAKVTLKLFPYPFINVIAGTIAAILVPGASDTRGPCAPAHTIDVAAGMYIAATLGASALGGGLQVFMDWQMTSYNETHVTGIWRPGNVIAFGGPGVNLITWYYHYAVTDETGASVLPVYIGFDRRGAYIYSKVTGTKYRMENDYWQGVPVTDYAMIVLHKDGDRWVLIVAGLSGYATWAISQWLSTLPAELDGMAIILRLYDYHGDGLPEEITVQEVVY